MQLQCIAALPGMSTPNAGNVSSQELLEAAASGKRKRTDPSSSLRLTA